MFDFQSWKNQHVSASSRWEELMKTFTLSPSRQTTQCNYCETPKIIDVMEALKGHLRVILVKHFLIDCKSYKS